MPIQNYYGFDLPIGQVYAIEEIVRTLTEGLGGTAEFAAITGMPLDNTALATQFGAYLSKAESKILPASVVKGPGYVIQPEDVGQLVCVDTSWDVIFFPDSTISAIPINSRIWVKNVGVDPTFITPQGDAELQTTHSWGDRTLAPGGWCQLYKVSDTIWDLVMIPAIYDGLGSQDSFRALSAASGSALEDNRKRLASSGAVRAVPYTVLASEIGKVVSVTGTGTVTLPATATIGNYYWVYIRNDSVGKITVAPPAGGSFLQPMGSSLVLREKQWGLFVSVAADVWHFVPLSQRAHLDTATKTASYQVTRADIAQRVVMNAAGATNITLPVIFDDDVWIYLCNIGVGTVSFSGTFKQAAGQATTLKQYQWAKLWHDSTGWYVDTDVAVPAVVDGLTSASTTSPLSANQGRLLQLNKLGASTGVPAAVGANVFTVRTDKPFAGAMYKEVGGVVSSVDNSYTWAARPSAAANNGAVITITDWNVEFFSNGTNWIPVNKQLTIAQVISRAAGVAGTGANQIMASDVIPAGLVINGCKIVAESMWAYTGTAGTHTIGLIDAGSGQQPVNLVNSAGQLSTQWHKNIWVDNAVNLTRWFPNSVNSSDFTGTTATITESTALDFSVARTFNWAVNGNAADTAALVARSLEIIFP